MLGKWSKKTMFQSSLRNHSNAVRYKYLAIQLIAQKLIDNNLLLFAIFEKYHAYHSVETWNYILSKNQIQLLA